MQDKRKIIYGGKPATLIIVATLHAIGEQAPYFSLTGEVWYPRRRDCEVCGCIHDIIHEHAPEYDDIAALHLSDIDGEPMYAEVNGWYHLAGYLGAAREVVVSRNEDGAPVRTHTEYTNDKPDPLGAFAAHVRLSRDDASRLASAIVRATVRGLDDPDGLYAEWVRRVDGMRPRWKREAEAAIARHGLTVTR